MNFLPQYRITANNDDLTDKLASRLKSLSVVDVAGTESDMLEIVLSDHDMEVPVAIPPTGAELEVWLGYKSTGLQRMGLYIADEVQVDGWPGCMTIRARAAPFEGSKGGKTDLQTQKTRSWPSGTKLVDMVAKIAKEHGLAPGVVQSLHGIDLPHLDQTAESDVSFLVRVARKLDAVVKPGGGKLIVAKVGQSLTVGGLPLTPVIVRPGDCTRWSMNISTRNARGTVVAYYQDRAAAKRMRVEVGQGEPVCQLRHNYPNQASAERAARAELDSRSRRQNILELGMVGDATLTAESPLSLVGFRPGIPTDWVVSRVVHRFEPATGYSCELEAERPR